MADWFGALTGLPDDRPETVRAGARLEEPWLHVPAGRLRAGALALPSLAELRERPPPRRGPNRLTEIAGDAAALHADPGNAGAVFQVASQFNLLEMVSPEVTPEAGIAGYVHDRTQGPACAMACAAGTIARCYLVPVAGGIGQSATRQIDAARDLHAALGDNVWEMRNGYAMPRPGGLARAAARIDAASHEEREALKGALRVGLQSDTQVTLPGAGHAVEQVYATALPVAYAGAPAADWEPLARLVLEAAYEATLRVAARAGAPVFLTLLGGGAFGNPREWILGAVSTAMRALPEAGLDARIVSHGARILDGAALEAMAEGR